MDICYRLLALCADNQLVNLECLWVVERDVLDGGFSFEDIGFGGQMIGNFNFHLIYNMDHLHGLCKECVSRCSEIYSYPKNQKECSRCQNPPEVIHDDNGSITVLCIKCYVRETSSPRRKSEYSTKDKNNSILLMSVQQTSTLYKSITKADVLGTKGFFSNEGKMLRKIEKYFSKFQGRTEQAISDLSKKSIVTGAALTWEKIVSYCNKTSSLVYFLVNQTHFFGFYHSEPVKINEKPSVDDKESGFFLSSKGKLDLQFYKANPQVVTYNNQTKSISLGKPACLEAFLDKAKPRLYCQLFQGKTEEWPEFYLCRM